MVQIICKLLHSVLICSAAKAVNEFNQLTLSLFVTLVCIVFRYLCTALVGCTLDRPRGSDGTRLPGQYALEDTSPHTGACVRGEALHRWGSEWRSSHRTHSRARSCDTAGRQDNPCWDPEISRCIDKQRTVRWTTACILCINVSYQSAEKAAQCAQIASLSYSCLNPWHCSNK